MKHPDFELRIPGKLSWQKIEDHLAGVFDPYRRSETAGVLIPLDTYEGHFLENGQVIIPKNDRRIILRPEQLLEYLCDYAPEKPEFWEQELGPSGWKLLEQSPIEYCRRSLIFENSEGKGYFVVYYLQIGPKKEEWIGFRPFTGFKKEKKAILSFLTTAAGLKILQDQDFGRLLGDSRQSSEVTDLLQSARKMEQGIIEDLDPECLHQYRVRLRKLKSLIGTSRTKDTVGSYDVAKGISELMKRTNRLRDLDVQAQEFGNFPRILETIEKHREDVFGEVRAWLQSREYQEKTDLISSHYQETPESKEEDFHGKQNLEKVEKKLRDALSTLTESEPDEVFHRVRVRVKKARYLAEVINDEGSLSAKELRSLQEAFGEFNDTSLQVLFLGELLLDPIVRETVAIEQEINSYLPKLSEKKEALKLRCLDLARAITDQEEDE